MATKLKLQGDIKNAKNVIAKHEENLKRATLYIEKVVASFVKARDTAMYYHEEATRLALYVQTIEDSNRALAEQLYICEERIKELESENCDH